MYLRTVFFPSVEIAYVMPLAAVTSRKYGRTLTAGAGVDLLSFGGTKLGLLLDMSPRNLERVLYFASYLVTDVDVEKRDAAIDDIKSLTEETIEEITSEYDTRIEEIRVASVENVASP